MHSGPPPVEPLHPAMVQAQQSTFLKGQKVMLHGLVKYCRLNDRCGLLVQLDPGGLVTARRWQLELDACGDQPAESWFKECNLRLVCGQNEGAIMAPQGAESRPPMAGTLEGAKSLPPMAGTLEGAVAVVKGGAVAADGASEGAVGAGSGSEARGVMDDPPPVEPLQPDVVQAPSPEQDADPFEPISIPADAETESLGRAVTKALPTMHNINSKASANRVLKNLHSEMRFPSEVQQKRKREGRDAAVVASLDTAGTRQRGARCPANKSDQELQGPSHVEDRRAKKRSKKQSGTANPCSDEDNPMPRNVPSNKC